MCGCGKKSVTSRVPSARPTIGPRSIQGGVAAGASPATIRSLSLQTNNGPKDGNRLDAERLRIEKLRREAIRNRLNK